MVDWTLEEYKNLVGFYPLLAGYGCVAIYDKVAKKYAGGTIWEWPFTKLCAVYLSKYTEQTVTLNMWSVQIYSIAMGPTWSILPNPMRRAGENDLHMRKLRQMRTRA